MSNPTSPVTLTPDLKGKLQDALFDEAQKGALGLYEGVLNPAATLVDPSALPPSARFAAGIARGACRRWARGDSLVRGPAFDGYWESYCTPYLDDIGEDPTSPASTKPPFQGGQCVGATYTIAGTQTDGGGVFCSDGSPVTGGTFPITDVVGGFFAGPIVSVQALPLGAGCRGGANGYFIRVVSAGGSDTRDFSVAGPAGFRNFTGFSVNASFNRVGGGASCGNPPPLYLPPGTRPALGPDPFPITVEPPGVGPTPVNVDFDTDGNITVEFPDLGIDFTVPNPLAGQEPPASTAPGDQGAEGDEVDGGSDPSEEEDPTRNLVGIRVTLTGVPGRANTRQNPTETYYAGAYYVYFGGDGGLAQEPTAALTRTEQYYYAPKGSNRFRVVPNAGFSLKVIPFWEEE